MNDQAAQPVPLASLKLSMAVYGQKLDGRPSRRTTKTTHSTVFRKGRQTTGTMPRRGVHSRPKLAKKARYSSFLKVQ